MTRIDSTVLATITGGAAGEDCIVTNRTNKTRGLELEKSSTTLAPGESANVPAGTAFAVDGNHRWIPQICHGGERRSIVPEHQWSGVHVK